MTKKKTKQKSKSFSEALGFNYIINERANFIYGLILLALAILVIVCFWSYFSTAAEDQSLVQGLRQGDMANENHEFRNACGSFGATLSDFFIARCFGIPAFVIPTFIILWSLKSIGAYPRLNLWKWFLGLAVVMLWCSTALAKFVAPFMADAVFNPGGGHGAYVSDALERVIGEPGLVAVLAVIAIVFLTFLTQETITVIRKILNPNEYIKRVKWSITNEETTTTSDDTTDDYDDTDPSDLSDLSDPSDLSDKSDQSDLSDQSEKSLNSSTCHLVYLST